MTVSISPTITVEFSVRLCVFSFQLPHNSPLSSMKLPNPPISTKKNQPTPNPHLPAYQPTNPPPQTPFTFYTTTFPPNSSA